MSDLILENEAAKCQEDSGYAETIYLSKDPKVKKEILDGKATPIEDCISENEVAALLDE